jgi:glycerate kinase
MTCDAFRRVKSSRYLFDKNSKTLYFELAECVGIKDLSKEELNPYRASTYGLGIAIKNAIIKHKPLKVIVGIGGSASNDGGSGMLEAMGVMFVDKNGNVIDLTDKIDADMYYNELVYYIDCLENNKPFDLCPVNESADAVRIVEAQKRSADLRGEKIKL